MLPDGGKVTIADQLAPLLIPETKGEGFEAGKQRDGFDSLEQRLGPVTFLQVVIWNPGAQMVDVMKADVAGEPLQYLRQFVKRASLQRSRCVIPFATAFPIDSLELMLHVEQPHPCRPGRHEHRQLNDQVRLEPENPEQPDRDRPDREICPIDRVPLSRWRLG